MIIGQLRDIDAIQQILPHARLIEAAKNVQHGRLSAARWTENGHVIARENFEVYPTKRLHDEGSHLVVFFDTTKLDDRGICTALRRRHRFVLLHARRKRCLRFRHFCRFFPAWSKRFSPSRSQPQLFSLWSLLWRFPTEAAHSRQAFSGGLLRRGRVRRQPG